MTLQCIMNAEWTPGIPGTHWYYTKGAALLLRGPAEWSPSILAFWALWQSLVFDGCPSELMAKLFAPIMTVGCSELAERTLFLRLLETSMYIN